MTDSTKALLGGAMACLTILGALQIIASCSVSTEALDTQISDCAKAGNHWRSNGGLGFCEEGVRK